MSKVHTLKVFEPFEFDLPGKPDTIYSIPHVKKMSADDAVFLTQIDEEEDLAKKIKKMREFVDRFNPSIEDEGLADMEYATIYEMYAEHVGGKDEGESKASQHSSKNTARQ